MPYYGSGNPLLDSMQQAMGIGQMIQQAQIQREAQARMDAKQSHDFQVDDMENRMKMASLGAQQASPDGSVGISGQLAQSTPAGPPPQAPGGAIAQAANGMPPTGSMGPLPSMTDALNTMAAGTRYSGSAPADPSRTVTLPGSGTRFQLPTLDEQNDQAGARAAAVVKADSKAKTQAMQDDLDARGEPLGEATAKYLDLDPGTKVLPEKLYQMIQDATARKKADAQQAYQEQQNKLRQTHDENTDAHNQATEAIAQANVKIAQQRADAQDRRIDAMGGSGGEKPVTRQQLIGIEARKATSIARAMTQFRKDIKAATIVTDGKNVVDPDKAQQAYADLRDNKQQGQDAYEAELQSAGVPVTHFEYPVGSDSPNQPAPAAAAPSPQAAAAATPAAAAPAPAQASPAATNSPAPAAAPTKKITSADIARIAKQSGQSPDAVRRRAQAKGMMIVQ